MKKILQLGADPSKLYAQFEEREETRQAQQEETRLRAEHRLTAQFDGEYVDTRKYRLAREAGQHLVVEPHLDLGDLSYSDYRKVREAQERGKMPLSFQEFTQLIGAQETDSKEPVNGEVQPPDEFDLEEYRESREADSY